MKQFVEIVCEQFIWCTHKYNICSVLFKSKQNIQQTPLEVIAFVNHYPSGIKSD